MGTCTATNQDGSSCSNDAMEGSQYCHVHQEGTGGTTHAAAERGFWTMLAGALAVIFMTYALLRVVLGL